MVLQMIFCIIMVLNMAKRCYYCGSKRKFAQAYCEACGAICDRKGDLIKVISIMVVFVVAVLWIV